MKIGNIVWIAVSAAVLSTLSIITAFSNKDLALVIGLAAITNAILATRE